MSLRTAERIHTGLFYGLAAVLVATAVALMALRLAVANAPAFQDQIEALLTRWLNRPVAISALDARLIGFTPELILRGVRIGSRTGRQADLAADRLEVLIDPWHTLRNFKLRLAKLSIDKLAVTLTRLADGHVVLGEERDHSGNQLFASIQSLRLRDASVTLVDQRTGKTWRLDDLHARFLDDAGVHSLAARFTPAQPQLAGQVDLAVRWHGQPRSLAEINGSGYLRLLAGRFDRIGAALPLAWGVPVVAGQGDARLWTIWRQGRPDEVVVDANIRGLNLGGAGAVRFQRLAGRGRWQRTGAGWNLDINALKLQRPGRLVAAPGDVSVRYSTDAKGAELVRARASSLRVGDLAALARGNERLPLKWRKRIVQLAPQGEIRDATLVTQTTSQKLRWRLSGRFQDLTVQSVGWFPGLSAGAGQFLATDRGGRIRLAAHNANLMLPELLSRPIALQQLQVQSEWRVANGEFQLSIPRLQARNSAGELDARLGLWLGGRQGPFIDARAHLRHGDAGEIKRYLPERILAKRLSEWLHNAIRAGRIQADLVLRGWTRDFPYRAGEGVFDVQAQVDDLNLAYYPGWPTLDGLSARLAFHQGAFAAELDSGRIYRSKLIHATADIPDLAQPRLTVRGRFAALGDDLLRFLRESPLAHNYAAALRQLALSGQPQLDLQLIFPFHAQPIEVDGQIDLAGVRLAADKLGLAIDDLTGQIDFDEDGVSWDQLRGRFNGHTVMSRAATTGPPGERRIWVDTRFQSSLAGLLGTDNPLAARLAGTTDWRLEVDANGFRSTERQLDLTLESELRGVGVNLPQPLAKPPSAARRLRIRTRLDGTGAGPIRVRYAQSGSAVLTLTPGTRAVERLGVHLGRGEAQLPKSPETRLTGTLKRFDLANLVNLGSGEQVIDLPPLRAIDLRIGTLGWANTPLVQALHVSARRFPDDWLINLTGPNVVGWIRWPQHEEDQAVVSLARLNLAAWPGLGAGHGRLRPDALNLPGIDLDIADLRVAGGDFGHLGLRLDRVGDGLALTAMELDGPVLKVNAAGQWSASGSGGRSVVDFSVSSENTGQALALFGFAKAIGNGTTVAQAHLQWPGTLLDFGPASVAGKAQLIVRDGSLLKIQPGVGRIFGLLSVATLPRRLMLDFSDLFGKGLAFDRIKADFRLENGTARPEIFHIDSPAARIEVSGPVNLVKREYDQTVTVMPHFSSTVTLLGTLAGGPLAGVVLFLTQKLFQASMEQLAQSQYRITGSWQHPHIEGMERARAEAPGVINDPK